MATGLASCDARQTSQAPAPVTLNDEFAHSKAPSFDMAALEADLSNLMAQYAVPGLAVSILEEGRVVYQSGFGVRDLETGDPVTPETRFRVGSVTKQFTAVMVGIAQDRGEVSLSDHPGDALPGLAFANSDEAEGMTVADLLSHPAGFGNMDGTLVFFPVKTREDLLQRLPHLPLVSLPGEAFGYSNMGYTLAGMIAAPEGFDPAIQERILRPLGMTRSGMDFSLMQGADNVAQGYAMHDGAAIPVQYEDMRLAGPSGALNSTAKDLSHWVAMLLNKGTINSGADRQTQLVSESFLSEAMSQQWPKEENDEGYGFGFFTNTFEGYNRVGHGGNTAGFSAHIDMLPEQQIGMVILSNQQNSDIGQRAADRIYAHILGLPRPDINEMEVRVSPARIEAELNPLNADDPPTFPLSDMVGSYRHEGYGTVRIRSEGEQLIVDFPDFSMPLRHEAGDSFVLHWTDDLHQNLPGFSVEFMGEPGEAPTGLRLPLRLGNEIFE